MVVYVVTQSYVWLFMLDGEGPDAAGDFILCWTG